MPDKSKIIAIESSGAACGVALSEGGQIAGEYTLLEKNLHDKLLAELIKRILSDTGNSIEEIDAVAVSSGPGSFTGLRIGGAIAKALCYENVPKLIAVPTLKALAHAAVGYVEFTGAKEIIAANISHKNYLYYQHFDINGKPLSEVIFSDTEEIAGMDKTDILFCGTACDSVGGVITFPELKILTARYIADLGYIKYLAGEFVPAKDFVPEYSQEFEPKIRKKGKS